MFSFKQNRRLFIVLPPWQLKSVTRLGCLICKPASLNSLTWNDSSLDNGPEKNVHHNRAECTGSILHYLSPISYLKQKCCVWTYILRQMRVSSWSGSLIHSYYITTVKPHQYALANHSGQGWDNVISCVYQTVWKTPEFLALHVLTHAEVTRVPVPRVTCHWPQVPDLTELEWHNYPLPNARITDLLDIILTLKLNAS